MTRRAAYCGTVRPKGASAWLLDLILVCSARLITRPAGGGYRRERLLADLDLKIE